MNEFHMKFIMRRSRKLRKQQFQSFRDRLKSKKLTSRSNSSSKDTGPKQIRHRESGKLFVLNPERFETRKEKRKRREIKKILFILEICFCFTEPDDKFQVSKYKNIFSKKYVICIPAPASLSFNCLSDVFD